MGRLKETIMKPGSAFTKAAGSPGVDLTQGGQNGFAPNYRGINSSANYVKQNLIAVLLEAPRGFALLPDAAKWFAVLKNLVEIHSQSIEGLRSTLTVEYVETALGGAGELQQDVSNVTRERSAPTFVWPEKYGMVINQFLDGWIVNLLMDPDTKVPRIMNIAGDKAPTDFLPDQTGMTVLFFEPDPTHTKVVKAWISTNMMPKTGGTVEGKRDLSAAGEKLDHSIEFTAVTHTGDMVRRVAQAQLDAMNLTSFNPEQIATYAEGVEADVALDNNGGFANGVAEVANAVG